MILEEKEIKGIGEAVMALLREHKLDLIRAYHDGEDAETTDKPPKGVTPKFSVSIQPMRHTVVAMEYDRGKVKNQVTLDDQSKLKLEVTIKPEKEKAHGKEPAQKKV